jgi:hypothetical protein
VHAAETWGFYLSGGKPEASFASSVAHKTFLA